MTGAGGRRGERFGTPFYGKLKFPPTRTLRTFVRERKYGPSRGL